MKRLLFSVLLACCAITLSAQHINFKEDNWKAVIKEAKASNKVIFLDAYTTWCGPCKYMSKNIFTDAKVADFYNATFVNAKFDMEKGDGLEIAKKYNVRAYPTLLFINGDGEVVHKALGSREADAFIQLGKDASNPATQLLGLEKAYKSKKKTDDITLAYAKALRTSGSDGFAPVIEEYLKDKNWKDTANMRVMLDFIEPTMKSPLFKFMLENKSDFTQIVEEERIDQMIQFAAQRDAMMNKIDLTDIDAIAKFNEAYVGKDKAREMAVQNYVSNGLYRTKKDKFAAFLTEAADLLKDKPDYGFNFYNSLAWRTFENVDDPKLLEQALNWADLSIEDQMNSYNTDTKAAILYKLKKKEDAMKWANLALALADVEGKEAKETKELIEKIKNLK